MINLPNTKLCLLDYQDEWLTISLDNRIKRNALSSELIVEMMEVLDLAKDEKVVRGILIRGQNDIFCSGADLDELHQITYNKSQSLSKVPLFKLAFARSGDKGNHSNIGVIARKSEYFPYINNELTSKAIENYFPHVLKGKVLSWCVPGINGINFLLKDSLGGGGMASMNIDPQGKSYAQQLLEYEIPVDDELFSSLNKT